MRLGRHSPIISFVGIVGLVGLTAFGAARARAEESANAGSADLKEVEALYTDGDFDGAARRLNELLLHEDELHRHARARLYLMKARLELAFDRGGELRLWLGKAHEVDPSLTLDPVLDPPQLHEVWEDVRRTVPTERQRPRAAKSETPEAQPPTAPQEAPATAPEPFEGPVATRSTWPRLLPLGIGHFVDGRYKDGALFLSSELLLALGASTLRGDGVGHRDRVTLGALTVLGAYGYELADSFPRGAARGLALFPFGVGQAANGAYAKAFGMAATEAALLATATLADDRGQKRLALGAFAAVWGYGVYDALAGARGRDDASRARLGVAPLASGAALTITLRR